MESFDDKNNLPGGPLPRHQLFAPRLEGDKEVGVKDPSGKFYPFNNGESFSQIAIPEVPGARVSVITNADGGKQLFEDWVLTQE